MMGKFISSFCFVIHIESVPTYINNNIDQLGRIIL